MELAGLPPTPELQRGRSSGGAPGYRSAVPAPALPPQLPLVDVIAYVLADLTVILLAARLAGGVFVRFRQPRVVGEMLAGILIGPTVLGGSVAVGATPHGPAVGGGGLVEAVYPAQAYAFLALFGVLALVLFMFLIGLEVPQHLLRGRVGRVTLIGVAAVCAAVGLGFALAAVLDAPGLWRVVTLGDGTPVPFAAHALLIGSGLAATALPVIASILQDKNLLVTPVGTLGIGACAVVTPLTFLVVAAASGTVAGSGVSFTIGIRLVLTAALVAVLFGIVRPLLRMLLVRRFRIGGDLDGDLLALLLAGALLSGLVANQIGIQALTGGLLFGAAVPQVSGLAEAVKARMHQFVVVLGIPVFLAVSALQTDLRVLRPEHLGAIALFVLAIAVSKWGVATVVGRAVGLPGREAGSVGVMLACGGLVTLVVALAGRAAGIITPSMQVVFVFGAVISTLVTGPLLDRLGARPEPAR